MTERNPIERPEDTMAVQNEINEQDLAGKSGAGAGTAIQLTLAGKCGGAFTFSYECTSSHVSCG
ncbi:salivaricin M family lantibiotic [Pseudobutyrivibrio sp. YE44]|uniref:salivaricin M family lantibiotic n=1 Tax=Pseudobutyrivibrio sp. YE44 TaxID=1520802 RepID=UPI000B88574C|nr:salivaricin M family lantibiotic [Pseudobutyrivibrio sp. YE44]